MAEIRIEKSDEVLMAIKLCYRTCGWLITANLLFIISSRRLILFAKDEDKQVGFTYCRISQGSRTAELIAIGVLKSYRRKGIGTMLMEETEKVLKEMGVKRIIAFVRKGNIASMRTMEKMGFRREKVYEFPYLIAELSRLGTHFVKEI